MFVKNYFQLNETTDDYIRSLRPEFGFQGFGEVVFMRTYSRRKPATASEALLPEINSANGQSNWTGQELWDDCVIRVINGVMSIRKDWYIRNGINWDEDKWQNYARDMAVSMFKMYWLPPGRGLWAMGTRFVNQRGSMALNNCSYVDLHSTPVASLSRCYEWMMDALMMGVGVGFGPVREGLKAYSPVGRYEFIIQDTRESWALSTKLLIDSYFLDDEGKHRKKPNFDYSLIRPHGTPIAGFGGLASGPGPLRDLHKRIENFFNRFLNEPGYDEVRLKTDIANAIGCCVVAGNVRRSAELAMGKITDQTFLDLKDYKIYPDREDIGWMSNNTVSVETDTDFDCLSDVAKRVPVRGEPGIANLRNFPTGRVGKKNKRLRKDKANGLNPCGEIPLESFELCNLSETAPSRCPDNDTWLEACEYAAFYSSTVSLLPTHAPETNAIIARNRRIGVGITGYTDWMKRDGLFTLTKYMRQGYKRVRETNQWANGEAGVPESIRVTTVKPSGSVSKLIGCTSGAGYPTFEHIHRRMRIAANNPIVPRLKAAGYAWEPEKFDPSGTLVFSFPTKSASSKTAEQASLWEQANNLVTLQREWADNAVSNTLYFKPKWVLIYDGTVDAGPPLDEGHKVEPYSNWDGSSCHKVYEFNPRHEEDDIESVLSSILPVIKACSLLPHTGKGVYAQMPESNMTASEYAQMSAFINPIDWKDVSLGDGQDEKFCNAEGCVIS